MCRKARRFLWTGLACCLLGTVSAGCGTSRAAAQRQRIAAEVLAVVDAYGVPVDFDFVGCHLDRRARVTCTGTTASEPTASVNAVFVPTGRCRGTLRVAVGTTPLATRRINPCR